MLRASMARALLLQPGAAYGFWAGSRRRGTTQQPQEQQQAQMQQQRRQHRLPAAVAGAGEPAGAEPPPKPKQQFKFCRMCGGPLELVMPDGNWRHVCTQCQYVDYQNPRLVVGTIVQHEGRILLCRRGIEPQRGLWTVPAGYLECGESSAAGAARETLEEAGARVVIDAPFVMFDIPQISQIYLLFRARLAPPFTFAAREPESLEAALFRPEDIPWNELAFSSVSIALEHYVHELGRGSFSVHQGVIRKRPGSGPNEPGSFQLVDHIELATPAPAPTPGR